MSLLIPIVDISYFVTTYGDQPKVNDDFLQDSKIKKISQSFYDALNTWGAVYIKGHGISQENIDFWFDSSREFFDQPLEKNNDVAINPTEFFGYVPANFEDNDRTTPPDLRESFNYLASIDENTLSTLPVNFRKTVVDMNGKCCQLSKLLLRILNSVLDIEDKSYFENAHKTLGTCEQGMLKALYYPGFNTPVISNQMRHKEHTDLGTITLLFQDDCGGLEVMSPSGEFVHAKPLPGTIIVITCDLLERWTSGKIKSSRHRVVVPKVANKFRQSFAYFAVPDDDVIVSCIDGSGMYPPVNGMQYVIETSSKLYT